MRQRHAIYYAPERGTRLSSFGDLWLGRNVCTGESVSRAELPIESEALNRLTEAPAHYGWHATLKPPFRLRTGTARPELVTRLADFARQTSPFTAPPLRLARLSSFLALVLTDESKELTTLAAACVQVFDDLRAEPEAEELERRLRSPLTDRQLENLRRWGYPYVFDEWQFHMSLTGSLNEADLIGTMQALEAFGPVWEHEVLSVTSLCLFEQPAQGAPFRLTERFPLAGGFD